MVDKDEKKLDEATEETKPTEAEKQDKPADEQKTEPQKNDKPAEEKASDDKQADENGEGADAKEEKAPEAPQLSETDQLKAENLTLKTQLEAMTIGFAPDFMEDAVILAEAIVKREGCDISAALQAVAKKYPDWKSDSKDKAKSGGFKVGADSSGKENKADDNRITEAFGIRKKK